LDPEPLVSSMDPRIRIRDQNVTDPQHYGTLYFELAHNFLPMSGTLSCVTARLEVVATNPVARNRAATSVFSGSFGISSSSSASGTWLAGRSIFTGAPDPFFLLGGVFFASSTSPSDSDSRGDLCKRRCKQKNLLFKGFFHYFIKHWLLCHPLDSTVNKQTKQICYPRSFLFKTHQKNRTRASFFFALRRVTTDKLN
jgi:hypothetical protein